MAINNSKHIPNLELAEQLFAEIANAANEIDRLCYHSAKTCQDANPEALDMQIAVMRKLVARMGWMADLGSKKLLGYSVVLGDAEQWLMHPSYTEELDKAKS